MGDEIATLGEQLEGIFGWKAHTSGDGILQIFEQGVCNCVLHLLLQGFHNKFPHNNILKKLAIDVAEGAEKVFTTHGVAVSAGFFIGNSAYLMQY
jgi:hypothetical protein